MPLAQNERLISLSRCRGGRIHTVYSLFQSKARAITRSICTWTPARNAQQDQTEGGTSQGAKTAQSIDTKTQLAGSQRFKVKILVQRVKRGKTRAATWDPRHVRHAPRVCTPEPPVILAYCARLVARQDYQIPFTLETAQQLARRVQLVNTAQSQPHNARLVMWTKSLVIATGTLSLALAPLYA
jgi:hypothetical protein